MLQLSFFCQYFLINIPFLVPLTTIIGDKIYVTILMQMRNSKADQTGEGIYLISSNFVHLNIILGNSSGNSPYVIF